MGFAVRTISFGGKTYNVDADVSSAAVDRVRNSTKGNDAKKVVGGAVLGAVIGQVIGKDTKGTVIGAAAGAAAGTAAAAATANYEGCVNDGGRIVDHADVAADDQSCLTSREGTGELVSWNWLLANVNPRDAKSVPRRFHMRVTEFSSSSQSNHPIPAVQ